MSALQVILLITPLGIVLANVRLVFSQRLSMEPVLKVVPLVSMQITQRDIANHYAIIRYFSTATIPHGSV